MGLGMATALSQLGARVVICSRKADVLESAAKAMREKGGDAAAVACDVRDPDSVKKMLDSVAATFGGLPDVVINNACALFASLCYSV